MIELNLINERGSEMKVIVNYKVCLLCVMLAVCLACQIRGIHSSVPTKEKEYITTIEYIYVNLCPWEEASDSTLEGVYIHINIQNPFQYTSHLWIGNKKSENVGSGYYGENVGGYMYVVHQQDTFRMDCRLHRHKSGEVQDTHYLYTFSESDFGNMDFERLQCKLKKGEESYRETLSEFFKKAEFYVVADSSVFANYIKDKFEGDTDIGYPKGKIKVHRKIPFVIHLGRTSDDLHPGYEDYIYIYPDSTLYERRFIAW